MVIPITVAVLEEIYPVSLRGILSTVPLCSLFCFYFYDIWYCLLLCHTSLFDPGQKACTEVYTDKGSRFSCINFIFTKKCIHNKNGSPHNSIGCLSNKSHVYAFLFVFRPQILRTYWLLCWLYWRM